MNLAFSKLVWKGEACSARGMQGTPLHGNLHHYMSRRGMAIENFNAAGSAEIRKLVVGGNPSPDLRSGLRRNVFAH